MRNGLYSIHMAMLDNAPGKGSGVLVLRDGQLLGGNAQVYLIGSYSFDDRGRWKGELITHPYAPVAGSPMAFETQVVSIGFSGTCDASGATVFATAFVGKRSLTFQGTMRWLFEL